MNLLCSDIYVFYKSFVERYDEKIVKSLVTIRN